MLQVIFGIIFFLLGCFYYKIKNSDMHKKYMYSTSKILEINFYFTLKEFMEMHNYGLKALSLVLEKCESDEQKQEYQKIIEVYAKKFDEIGNRYLQTMRNIFPYDLKYKTYKEVKETFDSLINK